MSLFGSLTIFIVISSFLVLFVSSASNCYGECLQIYDCSDPKLFTSNCSSVCTDLLTYLQGNNTFQISANNCNTSPLPSVNGFFSNNGTAYGFAIEVFHTPLLLHCNIIMEVNSKLKSFLKIFLNLIFPKL